MIAARILTAYYFIHFLIVFPLLGLIETPKPLPNSISESVLKKGKAAAAVLLALGLGALTLLGSGSAAFAAAMHRTRRVSSGRSPAASASSTGHSCSAASRSTRKSARPAMA